MIKIDETSLKVEVCPRCGSSDYLKKGFHKSKKYGKVRHVLCRNCKRYYSLSPNYVKGKRCHQKIFNLAIHLSYFNLSSRQIQNILLKYMKVKIGSHNTILKWIKHFGNPSYEKMQKHITEQIIEDEEFKRLKINKKIKNSGNFGDRK